jgi:hypothetical protein
MTRTPRLLTLTPQPKLRLESIVAVDKNVERGAYGPLVRVLPLPHETLRG